MADLLKDLQDKFGADTIRLARDIPTNPPVSSGSLALDFACGIGGLPTDRVIEVAGAEGCGKTTLGILAMRNFLHEQPKRRALILDTEHKLDPHWLSMLLGDDLLDRVIYTQPDSAEDATNIYVKAVGSGDICFTLFDSIGGSPTARVLAKDAETGQMGGNALAITRFAQFASIFSHKYRCLTFGVNQTRADMAGYNRHMTPGGHAWKHACVLRIQLKKGQGKVFVKMQGEDVQVGYTVVAKVIKNQLAAPGRTAFWWFYNVPTPEYGFGVDSFEETIRLGDAVGIFVKRGGWYHHPSLPEDKKGEPKIQGLPRLIEFVRSDTAAREAITAEIIAALKTGENLARVAPISDPEAELVEPEGAGGILTLDPLARAGLADE